MYQELIESKPSLSTIFQVSSFLDLVMFLRSLFWRVGDEFGKTKRDFYSEQDYLQKPPRFLHRHLILGEMKTSWDPIFQKFKR
jgi:hypothetical protein